jgi:hypothetical protein
MTYGINEANITNIFPILIYQSQEITEVHFEHDQRKYDSRIVGCDEDWTIKKINH